MFKKILFNNKTQNDKKENSLQKFNNLTHQNNNIPKIKFNSIIKREEDINIRNKQKIIFRNKVKPIFNIISNRDKKNNVYNKTINIDDQYIKSKFILKNRYDKELIESKKNNSNRIKTIINESLSSIHKYKVNEKIK